jgi:hypothetical protein
MDTPLTQQPSGGRWELFFADLEGIAADAEAADLYGEVAERARGEHGRLRLVDRLRPAIGHPVTVHTGAAGRVKGALVAVGPDWLLVAEAGRRETLVPVHAVSAVTGLGALSAVPGSEGRLGARLGMRYALRALVRNREVVAVTVSGGAVSYGTFDRVGADFIELAEHDPTEYRRRDAVRDVRVFPLHAIVLVRPV